MYTWITYPFSCTCMLCYTEVCIIIVINLQFSVIFLCIYYIQGLIPNEEEEQDLIAMNRPVLNAVSPENDFDVTDPNQTIGTYSILFIFTDFHL